MEKSRQKLEKIGPESLKYCSGVVRALGNRFFDPKYHLEVISRPWEQSIDTLSLKNSKTMDLTFFVILKNSKSMDLIFCKLQKDQKAWILFFCKLKKAQKT